MPAKCQQQQVGSSVNGTRERLSEMSHPVPYFFFSAWKLYLGFFFVQGGEEKRMNQSVSVRLSSAQHAR